MTPFGIAVGWLFTAINSFDPLVRSLSHRLFGAQAKEHPGYARVHGAALDHCCMVLSVTAAREQARLIIKGAQCARRRPGGELPLAVAAAVGALG